MTAPLLMIGAALLFSLMSVGVKLASARYGAGEIVLYRAVVGLLLMGLLLRVRGVPLRSPVPAMHFWRSLSGVAALCLWFYALGNLPLATAVTLNYMSSIWIALFLIGGSVLLGVSDADRHGGIDGRLVASVLAGFAGVALVLRPTIEHDQLWHGLCGLLSGLLSALAYLQVNALGRAGEPEARVVFYFSLAGVVAGTGLALAGGGLHGLGQHRPADLALLLGIGVLATAAQWMLTRAYAIGRTLTNAALQYLGIAFAFVWGVWWFDDPVTTMAMAGMALIVGAGLAATLLRSSRAPGAHAPNDT
jgi:S-adenosylmethionine uptake transporter